MELMNFRGNDVIAGNYLRVTTRSYSFSKLVSSRLALTMIGRRVVLLLLVATSCLAIVDLYKFKYVFAKETLAEIRQCFSQYYEREQLLLNTYSGQKAESCKVELAKNPGAIYVILQTLGLQSTGTVESLDKQWYEAAQRCEGDEACVSQVDYKYKAELQQTKEKFCNQISTITVNELSEKKKFLDCCLGFLCVD